MAKARTLSHSPPAGIPLPAGYTRVLERCAAASRGRAAPSRDPSRPGPLHRGRHTTSSGTTTGADRRYTGRRAPEEALAMAAAPAEEQRDCPEDQGPEASGAVDVAALEARVAVLKVTLAGEDAAVARAAAELAGRSAQAKRTRAEVAEAERQLAWLRVRLDPAWRDWAGGLPAEVLVKVAEKVVAQTEACQGASLAAKLKREKSAYWTEERIQEIMAKWKRDGNCLFVFARVCREWRKAQLKVGGPLRTRVKSDVILPGSVALAKWALAEGCPREYGVYTMANAAASYGHAELVRWLCGEGGFAMDKRVMMEAARCGNLELVQWLRAEGCAWDWKTCYRAVGHGHVEVLRWARENGCPWSAGIRDWAAAELGSRDDFGNLVDWDKNPLDDDNDDEYSDDEW